jgi:hypothetical protein
MVNAAEHFIQHTVASNQVTLETVKLMEVKKYFETFKPVNVQSSALTEFMAKYGTLPQTNGESLASNIELSLPEASAATNLESVSPLDMADLTNEQKYDMIKLRKEVTYTEAENAFMLNTGTMIMMQRARIKPVKAEDL